MSGIPNSHEGLDYYSFMEQLSLKRDSRLYFEVGVNEGKLMSFVHTHKAVGVDPVYVLSANAAQFKKQTLLIAEPSDAFFSSPDLIAALGGKPDLCFLDGFHTFEFLLRDFYKTEALCSRRSLIIMHDCLPLDHIMTIRRLSEWQSKTVGTRFQGSWTGDVWKIIPILQRYRPDLRIKYINAPPTGLVCITNLDPLSTVLGDSYFEIVDEFSKIPNEAGEISNLYGGLTLTSTHDVLDELDHTLAFGA